MTAAQAIAIAAAAVVFADPQVLARAHDRIAELVLRAETETNAAFHLVAPRLAGPPDVDCMRRQARL